MKKVLTFAVAAVMAFSLSMPAFAAATEGQMANEGALLLQISHAMAENKVDAAAAAAAQVVDAISETNSDVSSMTAEYVAAVLYETAGAENRKDVTLDGGEQVTTSVMGSGNSGSNVTMNRLAVTPATGDAPMKITFEATASGDQSAQGYLVSFVLPASVATYETINSPNDLYLTFGEQKLDTVTSVAQSKTDGRVIITAWVPHFSTYEIVFASTSVNTPVLPAPTPAPTTPPSGSGNTEPAATAAPTPAPAENPIKKTGADMSMVFTVLAAVTGVALVGGIVAVKKNGLDQ